MPAQAFPNPLPQALPVSRLAPSPTGALHLGNARTFLVNWALARRGGWRLVLRIEDLDTPRVKPDSVEQVFRAFEWLGIDWDAEPVTQSAEAPHHADAMRCLARCGLVYPCALTRAEIDAAASAPHAGDHESRFPPELRPATAGEAAAFDPDDTETNWRLIVPDEDVSFDDRFMGARVINPGRSVGDFVVWTKRAQASYQLGVVVDDARQGVTEVVRADDLVDSAARQILLRRALREAGWTGAGTAIDREPAYTHLPLVVGEDGRRLAKRHGDTRLDHYRDLGVPPEGVIGLLAFWCGIVPERTCLTGRAFLEGFELSRMPPTPVRFTSEDDRWLLSLAPSAR